MASSVSSSTAPTFPWPNHLVSSLMVPYKMNDFDQITNLCESALNTVAPSIVCRIEYQKELVYSRAFGWIDPEDRNVQTGVDTRFDLASVTKLFTTTACLRLVELGHLSLDKPVITYVPEFRGRRPVGPTEDPITKEPAPTLEVWQDADPVDADAITVRQLLTHSSGLPAWRNVHDACGPVPAPGYELSDDEINERQRRGIAAICSYDFAYPTGLSYMYSDLGLILLGEVVRRAGGYDRLDHAIARLLPSTLNDVMYNPLGTGGRQRPVTANKIAPTELCSWRKRRLHGEVHDENAAGLGGIAGHAGLFGTAENLCRLVDIYAIRVTGKQADSLLSSRLIEEAIHCQIAANTPGEPLLNHDDPCLTENPDTQRGLGWMLKTEGSSCGPLWSENSYGHTGYTGTSIWHDPDAELTVALLTNRVYNGRFPKPIQQLRIALHTEAARIIGAV